MGSEQPRGWIVGKREYAFTDAVKRGIALIRMKTDRGMLPPSFETVRG